MKRKQRITIALLCAFAMLFPQSVFVTGAGAETTGTYEFVEFGSYPQTEVVSQADDSGVSGRTWTQESDYIIDASLYSTLSSLSEDQWDANGDATVGDNRYRRIKAGNATSAQTDDAVVTQANDAAAPPTDETEETGSVTYYNWASTETYHYFKYEPIQWRILEQSNNQAFVLSEIALDDQMYNTNITGTLTWETSTVRSWLNGYGSSKNECGTDYSSNNFIDTAFTSAEKTKICTTTVVNADNIKSGTEGGNNTSDRIFLLSESELYGDNVAGYGFSTDYDTKDTARQSKSSTYAKAMGVESNDLGHCFWWTRSPGSYPGLFVLVRDTGAVFRGGQHANSKTRGVRPAMWILLSNEGTASGFVDPQNQESIVPELSVSAEIGDSKSIGFSGLQDGAGLRAESSDESVVTVSVENSSICLYAVMGGTADITVTQYNGETILGFYTLHVSVNFPSHTYEKDISVIVGETLEVTDESGDYSGSYSPSLLDSSIATVAVSGKTVEGTPGTEAKLEKITEFAAGQYIICSNNMYLMVDGTTLGSSTDPASAAKWTVTGSESSVNLTYNDYYLSYSTEGISLSKVGGRYASWKFSASDGLYFSSGSPMSATIYYLTCSGGFTVSTTNDYPSTLCSYTAAVPGTSGGGITTIQITGAAIGKTYVIIGETLYHITVADVNSKTTLKLPAELTEITSEAFAGTASEVIIVPAGCTAIAEKAFANCENLQYVFIPAGLKDNIPENAFEGCSDDLRIIYQ